MKQFNAALLFIAFLSLSSCRFPGTPVETKDFIMGTVVTQKVYGSDARAAADEAIDKIRSLEKQLSFFLPDSDLSKLNNAAGKGSVVLKPDTMYLLAKSDEYAHLSDGAFDILVGPLVKRWKVTSSEASVPPDAEIRALLKMTDYRGLNVDVKSSAASLSRRGQLVDLGGIAKGFAGDEVVKIYRKHGIRSGIIDIGGNICVLGRNPDGQKWTVGIQDPRKPRGESVGYLELEDNSLSTSGAYERFFKSGGKQYHHIIDPKTGYPSESDLISTTIISPVSTDTDALSTATFVLGSVKGMALMKKMTNAGAVFITKDDQIIATENLKGVFFVTNGKDVQYK